MYPLHRKQGFTLIELLVVVLILGMLSTLAVGVYTNQVERARVAAAKASIQAIEVAINRYQVDTGSYPPSGNKTGSATSTYAEGCGYLELALMHSMSGDVKHPASASWHGPYLTVKREMLGTMNGIPLEESSAAPVPGMVQILDPWHQPYRYVRSGPAPDRYETMGGTFLPGDNPYASTEHYYNPSTFQIVSKGPNGVTNPMETDAYGTDGDDVTNFGL